MRDEDINGMNYVYNDDIDNFIDYYMYWIYMVPWLNMVPWLSLTVQ